MKYLLAFPLLTSCSLLEPFTPIAEGGPTPLEVIGDAAPAIIADAGMGNWTKVLLGIGGIATVLTSRKALGSAISKLKDSEPGKIV